MKWLYRISDRLRQRSQRRAMAATRALGRRGEDLAHRRLQELGYRVVARNYKSLNGANEVDLVAWHRDHLVFVEVKTRSSDEAGTPDRAVTPEKQRRIVRAAMDYAHRSHADWGQVRFDVVGVLDGAPPVVEVYPDAFGADSARKTESKIY